MIVDLPLPPNSCYCLIHLHSQWVFWLREDEAKKAMNALYQRLLEMKD
jgi:hypothetical protein